MQNIYPGRCRVFAKINKKSFEGRVIPTWSSWTVHSCTLFQVWRHIERTFHSFTPVFIHSTNIYLGTPVCVILCSILSGAVKKEWVKEWIQGISKKKTNHRNIVLDHNIETMFNSWKLSLYHNYVGEYLLYSGLDCRDVYNCQRVSAKRMCVYTYTCTYIMHIQHINIMCNMCAYVYKEKDKMLQNSNKW